LKPRKVGVPERSEWETAKAWVNGLLCKWYLSVWIVSSEAFGFSAYALCVTADL